MQTKIALFRGINVGGKNTLKMKDLVRLLEDLGASNVRTYIQSGNVVFDYPETPEQLDQKISLAIQKHFGFSPQVLFLNPEDLNTAMQNNPFPEAESIPKTLHLGFLAYKPENPRLEDLQGIKAPSEAFVLKGKVFYLYAPDGVGRSKLAANMERLLGVSMTARNWNTVYKIYELAKPEVK